jgi:hypothetical protein
MDRWRVEFSSHMPVEQPISSALLALSRRMIVQCIQGTVCRIGPSGNASCLKHWSENPWGKSQGTEALARPNGSKQQPDLGPRQGTQWRTR